MIDRALAKLQDADAIVRARAVRRLRLIGGPQAVSAILAALDDPSEHVRAVAILALGHLRAPEAVAALIERLHGDALGAERALCADALDDIGDPRAVQPLIQALRDVDDRVVWAACNALMEFEDPQSIEPLLGLVDHPNWDVRFAACSMLVQLQVTDSRFVAAVDRLARDPDAGSYGLPFEVLALELNRLSEPADKSDMIAPAIEYTEQRIFETARADLCDPDPEVRRLGTYRLRALGGPQAVAALIDALGDSEVKVRGAAAQALGALGAPAAVPILIEYLLYDESRHVRLKCAASLHSFHDERAVEPLIKCLADPDWKMSTVAATALGSLRDPRAIHPLLGLLEHPHWLVRYKACQALVELRIEDPKLVGSLEKLAQNPEAEEYDLQVEEEWEDMKRLAREEGKPEPARDLKVHELLHQARELGRGREP